MSDETIRDESEALPPLPSLPEQTASASGYAAPRQAAPVRRSEKSPGWALLLSLFPGLGQLYNGEVAKAMVFLFGWAGSMAMADQTPFPFALLIPFLYFWNLLDAYRSAVRINERNRGLPVTEVEETNDSPAWGVTMVGIGLLLLLNNIGWLNLRFLGRFWPVLLIGAGGYFLWRSLRLRQGTSHEL